MLLLCCSATKCSVIGCRGNYDYKSTTHDARKGEPAMPIKSAFFASRRTRSRKRNGYVEIHRSCCRRTSWTIWLSVKDILTLVSSASLPVQETHRFCQDAVPTIFPYTPSYLSSPLKRRAPKNKFQFQIPNVKRLVFTCTSSHLHIHACILRISLL